jgi:hypothetical protein
MHKATRPTVAGYEDDDEDDEVDENGDEDDTPPPVSVPERRPQT